MKTWTDYGIAIRPGATGEHATICPKCSPHRQKNPHAKCLSANIEKGVWHCNHCDWSGALLTGEDNKSDPYSWRPKVYRKPDFVAPLTDLPSHVVEWFSSRGIPESILKRNRIAYEKVWMPQLEQEVMAIRFPFYRNGEVINVKSRDGKKNFRLESGSERILYGLDDAVGGTAIIVEGEMDKLSLESAGYINTVSVPDGAPSPKAKDYTSKFTFLENCEEFLSRVKTFILAVDDDEPGHVLESELARRLGRERCKRVQWPEGCKDANEVLVKHGPEVLHQVIADARDYPIKGLFDVADISPQIDRLYHEGVTRGELPGWDAIDELYSVRRGEWTLITGIPGHGKSEWLDAMMVNIARGNNWNFAIFSPENQPLERHFAKLAEKYIGRPFLATAGPFGRMTPEDLSDAKAWVNDRFTFLLPESEDLSVEAVLRLAKVAVFRKGIKGLVIDPWNELDHQRDNNISETEYISRCLTTIRRFARECDVHVWLVAHPQKLKKEKDEKGNMVYPVPTPYDVSGSAHWRNKADNCITVFRDFTTQEVEIHVQKIRFKEIGRVGMGSLRYQNSTGRYTDSREPFEQEEL